MVWSCLKCWSHCMYSASTHHWYQCMSLPGPVQSCGSYEQWYCCLWHLGLRLSPSQQNPSSRCLEETTWSPSQGVGSTNWWWLCICHLACPISCDRSWPHNEIAATCLQCPFILKQGRTNYAFVLIVCEYDFLYTARGNFTKLGSGFVLLRKRWTDRIFRSEGQTKGHDQTKCGRKSGRRHMHQWLLMEFSLVFPSLWQGPDVLIICFCLVSS